MNGVDSLFWRTWGRALITLVILLNMSACGISGRHQWIIGTSSDAHVEGSIDSVGSSIVADFRVLRLQYPVTFQRGSVRYFDDQTGKAEKQIDRTERWFQLDVPLLSLWDFKDHQAFGYPGMMKRRRSLEIWVTGSSNLKDGFPFNVAAGPVYYQYRHFAVGALFGWGSAPFASGLQGVGEGYPNAISGRHEGFWIGLDMTLFAGEFALELWDYLMESDSRHQKLFGR